MRKRTEVDSNLLAARTKRVPVITKQNDYLCSYAERFTFNVSLCKAKVRSERMTESIEQLMGIPLTEGVKFNGKV